MSDKTPDLEFLRPYLRNVGVDVDCGACMEVFHTGASTNQHSCRVSIVANPLIANPLIPSLDLRSDRNAVQIRPVLDLERHETGGTSIPPRPFIKKLRYNCHGCGKFLTDIEVELNEVRCMGCA